MVSLHSIGAVNTQLHHKEPPSWVWHIHWSSVLCKYKDMGSECQMGRFLPAYLQLKHCLHWKRRAGREAGCFTWLHSCCLLLGCHCWLESLTTTQVSSVLCHWAGLKISIKSHQDHLWVHAGHVIFKIQTYCAWLSHRDSIQISFFLSLILFKKKKGIYHSLHNLLHKPIPHKAKNSSQERANQEMGWKASSLLLIACFCLVTHAAPSCVL